MNWVEYVKAELAYVAQQLDKHLNEHRDDITDDERNVVMKAVRQARADLARIYSRLQTAQYVSEMDG